MIEDLVRRVLDRLCDCPTCVLVETAFGDRCVVCGVRLLDPCGVCDLHDPERMHLDWIAA